MIQLKEFMRGPTLTIAKYTAIVFIFSAGRCIENGLDIGAIIFIIIGIGLTEYGWRKS